MKALDQFMELMSTDPARAFYGYKHVKMANEQQAIETLMVSDSLFRSHDIQQRKRYVRLVEEVKNQVRVGFSYPKQCLGWNSVDFLEYAREW